MKNLKKLSLCLFLSVALCGCAGLFSSNDMNDSSGLLAQKDYNSVAKAVVNDCIEGKWIAEFKSFRRRRPVLSVGSFDLITNENIDTGIFAYSLDKALYASGEVLTIDSYFDKLLEDDNENTSWENRRKALVKAAKIRGADFILLGDISSRIDEVKDSDVVIVYFDAKLLNVRTGSIVWNTQKIFEKRRK